MKLKERMSALSLAVGNAEREYHKAVFEAVKKLGGSVPVRSEWDEEDEGNGVRVAFINKVLVLGDGMTLVIHINEEDYRSADYNYCLSELGDAADYVLDAIDWGEN